MMGQKARRFSTIKALSPDDLVAADAFYRQVVRVLDLSFGRDLARDCYIADKGLSASRL
jgi:hypothetical protein